MTCDSADRGSRLENVAAHIVVPENIQAAMNGAAPELSAGQVWRARWRDQVQMVAVLSIDQPTRVLPLSFDVDYVDASSMVISAEASPFAVPIVAWPSLKRGVPNVVLDRFVGWLPPGATEALRLGLPQHITDKFTPHPIRIYRALIEDLMDELSAVRWLGDGSGMLRSLLQGSGLRVQDVADTLGATPQRALAIWRGQLPLTEQEARDMAPGLGESVENILAANPIPPSELIDCLEHPQRHHQVLAYATHRNSDIAAAYRDLSYQTWALAARQTGEKTTNWDLRLDTFFAAVLDER